jgi:hypothetical protein
MDEQLFHPRPFIRYFELDIFDAENDIDLSDIESLVDQYFMFEHPEYQNKQLHSSNCSIYNININKLQYMLGSVSTRRGVVRRAAAIKYIFTRTKNASISLEEKLDLVNLATTIGYLSS